MKFVHALLIVRDADTGTGIGCGLGCPTAPRATSVSAELLMI